MHDRLGFRLMNLERDVSRPETDDVAVSQRLRDGDPRPSQERAVRTSEIFNGHLPC
jgi:hypothetical protein